MSDTDSFLQEVSEELRRDKLYRNIRKYGWIAIVLVFIIVGAATYREYMKSQAETEAELFGTNIIDALNQTDSADRISKLKEINPNIEFSSDFIIAYPGEEEKDLMDTISLIKEVKFLNSYSFIFSPRPGTVAENLKTINKKISLKRLEKVQTELFNLQKDKNKSLENKIVNVLVESQTKDKSKLFGRSEYMTSVIFDGKKDDIGKILPVRVLKSNRSTLFGEAVKSSIQKVA